MKKTWGARDSALEGGAQCVEVVGGDSPSDLGRMTALLWEGSGGEAEWDLVEDGWVKFLKLYSWFFFFIKILNSVHNRFSKVGGEKRIYFYQMHFFFARKTNKLCSIFNLIYIILMSQ